MTDERAVPAGGRQLQQHADTLQGSTNDEYHHEDPLGVFGVITLASGAVLSSRVYGMFNVIRNTVGGSLTPYVQVELMMSNESMLFHEGVQYYPSRSVTISIQSTKAVK